jgi:hypothetical protein
LNHVLFLVPSPSGYPSQQYSSSQQSPTPSRRSTLATTPAYDHGSLPTHRPAPPPLSGSTSYNPSFPVPVRYPDSNPSGPPAPAPLPMLHRSATMPMPMPVPPNPASSVPYDMRPPNTMHSPPQSGIMGGPQSTAQGFSYRASTAVKLPTVHVYNKRLTVDVHERDDNSSNFSDEDLEHRPGRERTRHSGEYMRDRSPPNRNSAGRQRERSKFSRQAAHLTMHLLSLEGGHGGNNRRPRPPPPELSRCRTCGWVTTRADAEFRGWYCIRGHRGPWELVVIILSLYETNDWTPSCPIIGGMRNTTKIINHHITS